jgi:competence protein ComGC
MLFIISILLWLGIINPQNTYTEEQINQYGQNNSQTIEMVQNNSTLQQQIDQDYGSTAVVIAQGMQGNGGR